MSTAVTTAYTGRVVARGQLLVAAALAGCVAVPVAVVGPWWVAVAAVVAVLATGVQLSVVRLAAGSGRVVVGLGPFGRGRVIALRDVTGTAVEHVGVAGMLGLTGEPRRCATRLTVRPGPALVLRLRSGEIVTVSSEDPRAALDALTPSTDRGDRP